MTTTEIKWNISTFTWEYSSLFHLSLWIWIRVFFQTANTDLRNLHIVYTKALYTENRNTPRKGCVCKSTDKQRAYSNTPHICKSVHTHRIWFDSKFELPAPERPKMGLISFDLFHCDDNCANQQDKKHQKLDSQIVHALVFWFVWLIKGHFILITHNNSK